MRSPHRCLPRSRRGWRPTRSTGGARDPLRSASERRPASTLAGRGTRPAARAVITMT
jgi:hypothetical protein